MSEYLTQKEVEKFLNEKKYRINDQKHFFPEIGGMLNIPLKTKNSDSDFILDIRKGNIGLKKSTFQTRVRKEIILARLDLGGAAPPQS